MLDFKRMLQCGSRVKLIDCCLSKLQGALIRSCDVEFLLD